MGQKAEARELAEECMRLNAKVYGEGHPETEDARRLLQRCS